MLQSGSFSEAIQYPRGSYDFENSIPLEISSLNVCHLGSLVSGFLTLSLSYFAFTGTTRLSSSAYIHHNGS
jgi:hypothetical protein